MVIKYVIRGEKVTESDGKKTVVAHLPDVTLVPDLDIALLATSLTHIAHRWFAHRATAKYVCLPTTQDWISDSGHAPGQQIRLFACSLQTLDQPQPFRLRA